MDPPWDEEEIEMTDVPAQQMPGEEGEPLPGIQRVSLRRQRSLQEQSWRVIRLSGLVLLAVVILMASIPSTRRLALSTLFPPHPSTPIRPLSGPGLFYLHTLPSWGTVWIDGRKLSQVPTASELIPGSTAPLRLAAGRHQVEWRADPFTPQHCSVVVPPQPGSSTCQLTRALPNQYTDQSALLTLPVSLEALPTGPRLDLIQAAQRLLDSLQSTTVVQPREHYVTAQSRVQQAEEPLSATLHFHLETQINHPATCTGVTLGHSCMMAQQDCRRFCTLQWVRTTQGWDVAAIVHPYWDYSKQAGQLLAQMQPDTMMRQGELQFVTFHIIWQQSHWHVTFHPDGDSSFDNPVCISTVSEIATNPATDGSRNLDLTWKFVSGTPSAAGCLAEATIGQERASSSPRYAYLLHRFGLLLAANEIAHQRWPELPVVTQQEQEVVHQIEAMAPTWLTA